MPSISSSKSAPAALLGAGGVLALVAAAVWLGPAAAGKDAPAVLRAGWAFSPAPAEDFPTPGLAMTRGSLRHRSGADSEAPPATAEEPSAADGDFPEFVAARRLSKPAWLYADKTVRSAITSGLAHAQAREWKYLVLHSSATTTGNARAFDYYHRVVKGMEHGLAYHFVITNGSGGPDGQIQIGPRWMAQEAGGHLRSDEQNEVAIGVCLVGDFQNHRPTAAQLAATDELIGYLRAKLGPVPVTTHRRVNVRPTLCPGKYFPSGLFVSGKL